MKRLVCYLLMVMGIWGQPVTTPSVTLVAPPPPSVSGISATRIGNAGNATYYYWVVARYPGGNSAVSPAVIVTNAPNTLSGGAYIRLNWNAQAGASGYDVLRTTGPTVPNGNCNCAVAIGTGFTTVNDTGTALSSYTVTVQNPASTTCTIDNITSSVPTANCNPIPWNNGVNLIADWCIDSVNGSDNSDGKCDQYGQRPFQTFAKLATVTITDGQTICLMRGSTWRETLTLPADNLKVYACGYGTTPLIDASNNVSSSAWSATGGQPNVYQASVTIQSDTTVTHVNAWEDGLYLPRASSLANCSATPGTSWVSSDTTDSIILYVHPRGNTNPASDGKTYAYSARQMAINGSTRSGIFIKDIWTRRNLHDTGSLQLGDKAYVQNMLVTDGSKHNAIIGENSIVVGSTAHNAYFAGAGNQYTMWVSSNQASKGGTVTFRNSVAIEDSYLASYGAANSAGFFAHAAGGSPYSLVSVIGCKSIGSGTSFNAAGISFYVANVTGDGTIGADATGTVTIDNAQITTAQERVVSGSNSGTSVYITNSRLETTFSFGYVVYLTDASLNIQDSTIVATNSGVAGAFVVGTPVSLVSLRNTYTVSFYYYLLGSTPATLISNYNSFGPSAETGNHFNVSSTDYTLAAWKSVFHQDGNSTP